ncbi:hypothetical protein [Sphingomonas sp.]|uniref:hypothetical protein n=1 Tax=Sphingomonas sp. TaxID=28214 RepID=UPI002DD650B6|nr:hypothetical protein [Sphingomonas sp.]
MVSAVQVEIWHCSHDVMLVYRVKPARTLTLPDHAPGRADDLWTTTCFELFAKEKGAAGYREFNFAPAGAWAAYAFSDWRRGMLPLDLDRDPHIVDCRLDDRAGIYPASYELDVLLGPGIIEAGMKLALSAVIEETDGTKSYWALKHPPGKPDFHHPDCFALELPALGTS